VGICTGVIGIQLYSQESADTAVQTGVIWTQLYSQEASDTAVQIMGHRDTVLLSGVSRYICADRSHQDTALQ